MTQPHSILPDVNAMLNATSAALLVAGYVCIRRRRYGGHATAMIAATATSTVFLVLYILYHYRFGEQTTKNWGLPVGLRTFYLILLATHIILAAANLPMIMLTLLRAARRRWESHRRIARWTLLVWLYVSITGVAVYFMLYWWFPAIRKG